MSQSNSVRSSSISALTQVAPLYFSYLSHSHEQPNFHSHRHRDQNDFCSQVEYFPMYQNSTKSLGCSAVIHCRVISTLSYDPSDVSVALPHISATLISMHNVSKRVSMYQNLPNVVQLETYPTHRTSFPTT